MMNEKNENSIDGWVTPSQYAKMHGISIQTVYNKIEQNILEYKEFVRGTMKGFLVRLDATNKND